MGPFNMPWLTFSAFIVIDVSILIAVLWAVLDMRKDGPGGSADREVRR